MPLTDREERMLLTIFEEALRMLWRLVGDDIPSDQFGNWDLDKHTKTGEWQWWTITKDRENVDFVKTEPLTGAQKYIIECMEDLNA